MATDLRQTFALPALLATLLLISACRAPRRFESTELNASYPKSASLTRVDAARPVTQDDTNEVGLEAASDASPTSTSFHEREQPRLLPPADPSQAPTIQLASAQEELPPEPAFEPDTPEDAIVPEYLPDSRIIQEMTIDELVEHARANHPLLAARYSQADIARARLVAAGKFINPNFVLDTDTPVYTTEDPTELSMRLMFPLQTGHKRQYRRSVAWAGIRRAQLAASREEELIVRGTVDRAVEVLYLQQLVDLHEQLGELAQKRAESLVQPVRPGGTRVNLVDQVEADMAAVSARSQELDATRRLRVARMQLAEAVGMSPDFLVSVAGELETDLSPLLPLDSVLAIARQRNPAIAEAVATVAESRSQYCLQRSLAIPDLELGPLYQDRIGVDDDQIGGRIQSDLPIFDRNEGGILEASAQIRTSQALVDVAELSSIHAVGAAYLELETLRGVTAIPKVGGRRNHPPQPPANRESEHSQSCW